MSSLGQPFHEFADLFTELFDGIEIDVWRERQRDWLVDQALLSKARAIAADVEAGRPWAVRNRARGDDLEAWRFAVLRGLDYAFRYLNPAAAGAEEAPRGLARLRAYEAVYRRLDSGQHGGALIVRRVRLGREEGDAEHPRELFDNVLRVSESSWRRAEYIALGEATMFHRPEVLRGITVACVPCIADPAEMLFETHEASGRRYYRVGPAGHPATAKRITDVIARLDRCGAQIAVAPELTLTPALLERWQAVLRRRDHRGTRLRLVVAGTGDLAGAGRPTNTAVLLDGRTGEIIARQDKLHPFSLSTPELERWHLTDRLGSVPIAEDMAPGRSLTVLDAGGLRMAIVICEDLDRVLEVGPIVRDFGVSHLLVPVFARPTRDRRWERSRADIHARETGSTVIVSNSMVMASVIGSGDGTSLVVWPDGALVGRSPDPAEPACFVLRADGSAEMS